MRAARDGEQTGEAEYIEVMRSRGPGGRVTEARETSRGHQPAASAHGAGHQLHQL